MQDHLIAGGISQPIAAASEPPRKRVLIGHSLGAISATLAALEREDVEALVLVCPAILVWPGGGGSKDGLNDLRELQQRSGDASDPTASWNFEDAAAASSWEPRMRRFEPVPSPEAWKAQQRSMLAGSKLRSKSSGPAFWSTFGGNVVSRIGETLRVALALLLLSLLRVLRPLTIIVLRALVRNQNFWLKGLQSAFYDRTKVTVEVRLDLSLSLQTLILFSLCVHSLLTLGACLSWSVVGRWGCAGEDDAPWLLRGAHHG